MAVFALCGIAISAKLLFDYNKEVGAYVEKDANELKNGEHTVVKAHDSHVSTLMVFRDGSLRSYHKFTNPLFSFDLKTDMSVNNKKVLLSKCKVVICRRSDRDGERKDGCSILQLITRYCGNPSKKVTNTLSLNNDYIVQHNEIKDPWLLIKKDHDVYLGVVASDSKSVVIGEIEEFKYKRNLIGCLFGASVAVLIWSIVR